jgi:predicted HTH transcriptional regulator
MNGGMEISIFQDNATPNFETGLVKSRSYTNKTPKELGLVKELVKRLVKGLVKELSTTQIEILNLISENRNITKSAMAKHIGTSTTTIDNHIEVLKNKNVIERVGGRKTGYWEIIEQSE